MGRPNHVLLRDGILIAKMQKANLSELLLYLKLSHCTPKRVVSSVQL